MYVFAVFNWYVNSSLEHGLTPVNQLAVCLGFFLEGREGRKLGLLVLRKIIKTFWSIFQSKTTLIFLVPKLKQVY